MSKEEIKQELAQYEPNEEERAAIKSAVFNFVNLSTVGAGSLGLAGYLWNKSRPKRTGIPTILGFFTGLALGGALGMDKGMRTLRARLPSDSKLLSIIHETDQMRHGSVVPFEGTKATTPVNQQQEQQSTDNIDAFVPDDKANIK
ncbi:hypothetical protein BDB00DRAFT_838141 [Zychaea mexicana]|uniref:uncharacterized protein n=1 Tax=Zychaea mexicana TaxID=64656 RepID=UPI0022FE4695|nr:uncharacterized protein BDB00DRAFT_838141 [Zychaea mexicana]KAI9490355.1 hypothetical protein BDB00DRAFT_838141 [Zychaea mexicana]